jgi:predicted PurR-regulated permease PerM
VLTPFAAGFVLTYLLAPGVDWMTRHKTPRAVAALIVILLSALALLGLLLILIPLIQREIIALQAQFPALINKLNQDVAPRVNRWFGTEIRFDGETLRALLADKVSGQSDLIASLIDHARAGVMALIGWIGTLFLVPVVLFYALLDYHRFVARFEAMIPRRWHDAAMSMLKEIDALLANFLRGQLAVMGILAAYYAIGLSIARFQGALPIGILTGLLVFIPYLGFGLGLTLALLAAQLQFGNAYGFIAVAIVYGLGQIFESFFLTPKLVGHSIGMHPLAVIFALLAFGQVFGFFGVLLALPASAVLMVGLARVRRAYVESDFYLNR